MPSAATAISAHVRVLSLSLDRARVELPALEAMLDAFGPLLAARARLREDAPGWTGPGPDIGLGPDFDADRFCQGAFVLADSGFQDMSAHLHQAAKRLLPVMAQSFPAIAAELAALGQALDTGVLPSETLTSAGFGEAASLPGCSAATLAFAASELVRPFVERQAQDLLALVKDLPWRQSSCPICGGAPSMSVLRRDQDSSAEFIQSHGGRRFLRCSCCSSEWTHKRVSCPACGCEEPDELVVLHDPARPFERADACTRCKAFVLCLDSGEMIDIPDPDVAALTMLPLAIQAQKQGFKPMAENPWGQL